jgi:hypothetical protein
MSLIIPSAISLFNNTVPIRQLTMTTTTLLGLTMSISPPFLTLLRIVPLLSTTASLTHAYMELVTTSSFLSAPPTSSALSKRIIGNKSPASPSTNTAAVAAATELAAPAWFVNFFNKGVWSVIGLNSITLVSASANLWVFNEGLRSARAYYLVGLAAALGHYVFVPLVGGSVERLFRICHENERGDHVGKGKSAVESVREWVGWHRVRMGSVDVVAWGAFLGGVLEVLTTK